MKGRVFAVLICVSLASCGIFKKELKHKRSLKLDSATSSLSEYSRLDTGTILTYERTIGTVDVPGQTIKTGVLIPGALIHYSQLAEMLNGLSSSGLQLMFDVDTLGKKLNMRAKTPAVKAPVFNEKYTAEKKGTVETGKKSSSTEVKKQETSKVKTSDPDYSWLWKIIPLVFVLLVIFGLYKRFWK